MEKIAIYGKGGIGKSMVASNLSVAFASKGLKVLHVGCDPKHDSTLNLRNGKECMTVIDAIINAERPPEENIIITGTMGIHCIEAGGPKPGCGCAGRGILKTFEVLEDLQILEKNNYDVVIFDVLGDVVCGGFAAPLRKNYAEKVLVVVSEEFMSLYAANNITQAISEYSDNGVYLGGLIVNKRNNKSDMGHIEKFAEKINTDILTVIPRSSQISKSEEKRKTVVESLPSSNVAKKFDMLSDKILEINKKQAKNSTHLSESELYSIFKKIY